MKAATGAPIVGARPYRRRAAGAEGLDASHDLAYAPERRRWTTASAHRRARLHAGGGRDARPCRQPSLLRACRGEMRCSRAITSWPGRRRSSLRRMGRWATTWPRSKRCASATRRSTGPATAARCASRGATCARSPITAASARPRSWRALEAGDATVPEIVARVYENLKPALVDAASLSTLAHLEDLRERGRSSSTTGRRARSAFSPRLSPSRLARVLHRGGEASEVTRVGAEIMTADARHRAQVDARLGRRPYAHRDVVGEAEHRRAGDRLDLRDAVDAQVRRIGIDQLQPRSLRRSERADRPRSNRGRPGWAAPSDRRRVRRARLIARPGGSAPARASRALAEIMNAGGETKSVVTSAIIGRRQRDRRQIGGVGEQRQRQKAAERSPPGAARPVAPDDHAGRAGEQSGKRADVSAAAKTVSAADGIGRRNAPARPRLRRRRARKSRSAGPYGRAGDGFGDDQAAQGNGRRVRASPRRRSVRVFPQRY